MFELLETLGLLLKVSVVFFLLYIFLPLKVMKKDYDAQGLDTLDRFFISLVHSTLIVIILVHLLTALKLYETISLLFCLVVIMVGYRALRSGKEKKSRMKLDRKKAGMIFDMIESEKGLFNFWIEKLTNWIKKVALSVAKGMHRFIRKPAVYFFLVAVFLVGAYIRFSHSLNHVYFGAADPYVHLAWTKYIGTNSLYVDGVYPQGYNALISALNKLFFMDPYVIIRFIGAIGGCLILLSILYGAKKQYKEMLFPALFGLGIYILMINGTSSEWRQMSALPQEYAAAFLIPGLVFLNRFFTEKKRIFLILAAETLCLVLLIHLYSAVVLVIGYLLICLFYAGEFFNLRFLGKFTAWMIGAALIGILPLGIGLLSGIELHAPSFQFVVENAGLGQGNGFRLFSYREQDPILIWLLICSGALLVLSMRQAYQKKTWLAPVSSLLTFFFYMQYRAYETGIPQIMDRSRTQVFLWIFAALTVSLLAGLFLSFKVKWFKTAAVMVFVGAALFINFNPPALSIPRGDRYEYNETAQAYMNIRKEYPVLNWTIVSPVEQYSESLGYGWHYQLWQFVKDVTEDGNTELKIPSEYVFWIVEKVPLNSEKPVTPEDAQKEFPKITGDLDEYYTNDRFRRIIQAKAFYYMEEQLEKNRDLKIYLDTEHVKIYMLRQEQYESYSRGS